MPATFSTPLNQSNENVNEPTVSFNTPIGTVPIIIELPNGDLTSIANVVGTSGFLKKIGVENWALDPSTYITGNQQITVYGDATGSGTTGITLTLATVPLAKGGTGAVNASEARANLGLTIGQHVQAWDADLSQIAGLTDTSGVLKKIGANSWTLDAAVYLTANQLISVDGDATGSGTTGITLTLATVPLAKGGTGAVNASGARANLGLTIGQHVQAWDADLDSIAAIAANSGLLKKTGAGAWSLDTNNYITANQSITLSGDATGIGSNSINVVLSSSGVTAGTYTSANITVDSKGRVTYAASGSPSAGAITSVIGTSPVSASTTSGAATVSMAQAASGVSGYLSGGDWATFNNKQSALSAATTSTNGYLTSADWNTFNNKQSALSQASASFSGYLTSTDWSTFNNKQATMAAATTAVNGYLTSTDWNIFNNKQNTLTQASPSANGYLTSGDWIIFNNKQNALPQASASQTGYLSGGDWNTFNNKQSALSAATTSTNGYLTSADWNTFNGKTTLAAVVAATNTWTATQTFNNSSTYSALFTGGNVGIGTTTPTSTLHINETRSINNQNGMFNIANISGSMALSFTGTGTGTGSSPLYTTVQIAGLQINPSFNFSWSNFAINSALSINPTWNSINTNRFIAATTGIYLSQALSGAGTVQTAYGILIAPLGGNAPNSSSYGLYIENQGKTGTPYSAGLYIAAQSNSTEAYSAIFEGGNVGVLQPTPGSALDVKGTIRLSGTASGYVGLRGATDAGSTTYVLPATDGTNGQFLKTNGEGDLSWGTVVQSVSSVSGTSPVSASTTSGAVTVSMAQATTSTDGYLTSTDWNTFNSKQATLSAATTSTNGYLTSTDWNTFSGKTTLAAVVAAANTWAATQTFNNSSTYSALFTGGNVGIGTTTPAGLLEVKGKTVIWANAAATLPVSGVVPIPVYSLAIGGDSNPDSSYGLYMGVSDNGTSWIASQSTATTSTYNLVLNPAGGNVGIGASTPAAKLAIGGQTSQFPVGVHIYPSSHAASGSKRAALLLDTWYVVQDTGGAGTKNFGIYGGTTPDWQFAITAAGNVGIGTTTPGQKLEVKGSSDQASGGTWNSGTDFIKLLSTGNFSEPSISFQEVGAGNQDVGAKISVKNPGYGAYDIIFANRPYGAVNAAGGSVLAERMRIVNDGNVGIGTTSPGSKLDVKGTLRLSGSTSGYVGFSPAAAAGSTTYTLPSAAPSVNGQALTSTTGGAMSWTTISGGGSSGRPYTYIGSVTVSGTAATMSFTSIAATYTDLYIRFTSKINGTTSQYVMIRFNADTGTTYQSGEVSWGGSNLNNVYTGLAYIIGGRSTASTVAETIATGEFIVANYANTSFDKMVYGHSEQAGEARVSGPVFWDISGKWNNTAAITAVSLTPFSGSFVTGSYAHLYGRSMT